MDFVIVNRRLKEIEGVAARLAVERSGWEPGIEGAQPQTGVGQARPAYTSQPDSVGPQGHANPTKKRKLDAEEG